MPCETPIRKVVKNIDGQLLFYVVRPMPKKFQEIISTLKKGPYNTRYELNKFYKPGTVSAFIKTGLQQGFLKQRKVIVGSRIKAILELVY